MASLEAAFGTGLQRGAIDLAAIHAQIAGVPGHSNFDVLGQISHVNRHADTQLFRLASIVETRDHHSFPGDQPSDHFVVFSGICLEPNPANPGSIDILQTMLIEPVEISEHLEAQTSISGRNQNRRSTSRSAIEGTKGNPVAGIDPNLIDRGDDRIGRYEIQRPGTSENQSQAGDGDQSLARHETASPRNKPERRRQHAHSQSALRDPIATGSRRRTRRRPKAIRAHKGTIDGRGGEIRTPDTRTPRADSGDASSIRLKQPYRRALARRRSAGLTPSGVIWASVYTDYAFIRSERFGYRS